MLQYLRSDKDFFAALHLPLVETVLQTRTTEVTKIKEHTKIVLQQVHKQSCMAGQRENTKLAHIGW